MKVSDQIGYKAAAAVRLLAKTGLHCVFESQRSDAERPWKVTASFRSVMQANAFNQALKECCKIAAMLEPPVEAEFEVKAESKWEPKPGDWVMVRKPKEFKDREDGPWWNCGEMDYIDGAVVQLVESDFEHYRLACKRSSGDSRLWHLHLDWLSPAEKPKAEEPAPAASAAPSVDADLAAEAFEALEQMVNAFSAKTEYMNTARRNAARLTAIDRAVAVVEKVKAVK